MKKILAIMLCLALTLACFAGCGPKDPSGTDDGKLKVACLLNGNLGDKSFFDSANEGMKLIKSELDCETKVIEMGFDNTKWEPTLYEISDQDYDIIIVGTYQMEEILEKVAPQYPDKRYIIFDSGVNYELDDFKNVYAVTFKQNEASYLAGTVASMVASDKNINKDGKNIAGVVAAMDIPVLNDFIVGYIEGAIAFNPETKVTISYIGDFNDTAKAKELALAQFNMGAAISMNVAAQAGLGLMEAAGQTKRFAIGVDADQAMALKESRPLQASQIVTSVLKNIDQVILRSVKLHIEGKLPYGKTDMLGMEEKAVGIAVNEIYDGILSAEMRAKIKQIQSDIQSGKLKVSSAFSMTSEQIKALKDSVKP